MDIRTGAGETMMVPGSQQNSGECRGVRRQLSAYLDSHLRSSERSQVEAHLSTCRSCSEEVSGTRKLRRTLRALPQRSIPPDLNTRLRVLASHESTYRRATRTLSGRVTYWSDQAQLWMNNLMRPFAIPAAGGLMSAFVLFGMLAAHPAFRVATVSANDDVISSSVYTEASLKSAAPLEFIDDDVIVELTVDEHGAMLDYTIPNSPHIQKSPELRRTIESTLLFTRFTPATSFGQPTKGKFRISLRGSKIDVRG